MSLFPVRCFSPLHCSGDMYAAVPIVFVGTRQGRHVDVFGDAKVGQLRDAFVREH